MKLLFIAPRSVWRKALDTETRLALEDGHHVRVIVEDHPELVLDPRVEVEYIGGGELHAPEPRLQGLLLRRFPLGGLRRIGRGPLRRPAGKVARRSSLQGFAAQGLDLLFGKRHARALAEAGARSKRKRRKRKSRRSTGRLKVDRRPVSGEG